MSRLNILAAMLSATALAVTLTGCADNRMDGGYTGDTRSMSHLTAPQPEGTMYVYRGGRDPVTGKASSSY